MSAQKRRRARTAPAKSPPRTQTPQIGARAARTLRRLVRRRPAIVLLALLALHVLFALLTFEPRPHTGGDNAAYITLARSLLERGDYTELWDPQLLPHTKYPPIFPAILAGAMAAGLQPWVQLKLVVLAFSAAALAGAFLWMRARRRPLLALGVSVIIAVAPGVLREGRWILSDVPFWAFTMLALWAFQRVRPGEWRYFAVAAVATLLAYFTRSAGLPLVVAALAWLAWRRSWVQLATLATLIAIPAIVWWLRARAYGPAGYISEFWLIEPYAPELGRIGVSDLFTRMGENIQKYLSVHLPVLLTEMRARALLLLSSIILVLSLYGWGRRLRRATVAELFMPLYIGLIFVWPAVWSGERFLLPALPLILFYSGDALSRLARRFTPRATFVTGAAACALLLLVAAPGLVRATQVGRACTSQYLDGHPYPCLGSAEWNEFFQLAELSSQALPDHAVMLSRKPRLVYVLSGLRGRNYPLSPEPSAFFATADSIGAQYVLYDRLDGVSLYYLQPVLARMPAAFCLMGVAPAGTALFAIRDDARAAPDLGPGANPDQIAFDYCGDEYWRSPEARRQLLSQ